MPRSLIRRGLSALAALLGLGQSPVFGAPTMTPEQAPPAWVAYAENATRTMTGWLSAETPPAPRVRAVLDATRPAPDQPTAPLSVKIWIGRDGAIRRIDFPPLADGQANHDLITLLVDRRLPPPPPRMRQPMRVALQLAPRQ